MQFVDGLSKRPKFLEDIYNDRHAMFFFRFDIFTFLQQNKGKIHQRVVN